MADVLNRLLSERTAWHLDLADLWLAPAANFFGSTPEGAAIIRCRPALDAWWQRVKEVPSVSFTLQSVAAAEPRSPP